MVIESGWGDSSAWWGWVQPEVAKTTRVCTYDRAGMGWSEASPPAANCPGNLLKKCIPCWQKRMNPARMSWWAIRWAGIPSVCTRMTMRRKSLGSCSLIRKTCPLRMPPRFSPAPKPGETSLPVLMARASAWRASAVRLDQRPAGRDKQAYSFGGDPSFHPNPPGRRHGDVRRRGAGQGCDHVGRIALIVLSRGKDMDAESAASQARYLQLSTESQHLIADQSGHRIMIEQPEARLQPSLRWPRSFGKRLPNVGSRKGYGDSEHGHIG